MGDSACLHDATHMGSSPTMRCLTSVLTKSVSSRPRITPPALTCQRSRLRQGAARGWGGRREAGDGGWGVARQAGPSSARGLWWAAPSHVLHVEVVWAAIELFVPKVLPVGLLGGVDHVVELLRGEGGAAEPEQASSNGNGEG